MGCCDPEYRKFVLEKEKDINEKGKENIPISVKILIACITLVGVGCIFII